jgi:thiamine kinase-like enzyme
MIKRLKNQGLSHSTYIYKNYIIKKISSLHVEKEFTNSILAYKKGVGAKPIFFDKKRDIMCFGLYEGIHKTKLKRIDIVNLAKTLKILHSIKDSKKRVFCHKDLNPQNIIFGKKIKFIDWEYASFDDCYFDLACLIIEFNLSKKEEKILLKSYFKNKFQINYKKVLFFKKKYLLLCISWFKQRDYLNQKVKFQRRLSHSYL